MRLGRVSLQRLRRRDRLRQLLRKSLRAPARAVDGGWPSRHARRGSAVVRRRARASGAVMIRCAKCGGKVGVIGRCKTCAKAEKHQRSIPARNPAEDEKRMDGLERALRKVRELAADNTVGKTLILMECDQALRCF